MAYPLISQLGQFLNWILLANIVFIAITEKTSGKLFFLFVIFITFLSKFFSAIGFNTFQYIYLAFYSLIFIITSKLFLENAYPLFKKQLVFFLYLSIPIMLLQLLGVPHFLQRFNTLYAIEVSPNNYEFPDFETISILFKRIDVDNWGYESDITKYLSMQVRPPGLLHSSAMQAPFVLATGIFILGNLINRKLCFKDSLICIAIVLCGAKVALYGFLGMLLYSYLIINLKQFRRSVITLFQYLIFYLFIYNLFFPLAFYQNFSLNSLNGSFFFRVIDFLSIFGGSFVTLLTENFTSLSELSDSYEIITLTNNSEVGTLSGLRYLFFSLPFIVILYFSFRKRLTNCFQQLINISLEKSIVSRLSFLWIIVVLFATPLFGSSFFSLFLGFAIYPIIRNE
jgi:hypothetical protein